MNDNKSTKNAETKTAEPSALTHLLCPTHLSKLTKSEFTDKLYFCKKCRDKEPEFAFYTDAYLQGYWVGYENGKKENRA